MTMRKSKKGEAFGRLFVLGGFTLVSPSRASGGETDEVNAPLKREQGSVKTAVGRDADQEPLQETTESRREGTDRQAMERGENEGMIVGPE